jgi:hypothetical protein
MKNILIITMVALMGLNVTVNAAKKADKDANTEVITDSKEIRGVVYDKTTNESLAGAVVMLNGQKVYTDLEGNFTLKNVDLNSELKISMISYQEKTIKLDVSNQKSVKILLSQQ